MSAPFHGRKLGKLPARHDARTYRMAAPLAAALPTIPVSANWANYDAGRYLGVK